MPSVKLSPILNDVQFLTDGTINAGGYIYTYAAGSSTPQATYTDSTGNTAQANPIQLNAFGQVSNPIWLAVGLMYKMIETDSVGNPIGPTFDNISGVNDASTTGSQWLPSGLTPTYIGTTSFTFAGDQTSTFTIGRRLQFTVTAGTVYGRIFTSTFAAVTTIVMVMDGSQVLDSGLSAVSYGILSNDVLSIPYRVATASGTDTYTASVGITRLVTDDEYKIKIVNPNLLTTSTLNLDGTGAKTIKVQSGASIGVGQLNGEHTFRYNGTDMVVLNPFISNPQGFMGLTAVVGTNALTATLASGTRLDFNDGTSYTLASSITASLSSGSTAGTVSATPSRIWVVAVKNSGTPELALRNNVSGTSVAWPGLRSVISTTAEGGAGGADSAQTFYSTTARSNQPWCVVGYIDSTQTTAGTWAQALTLVQGYGPGIPLPGSIMQPCIKEVPAYATGSAAIPFDNSIPQIGEGNLFMSADPFTPTSASNILGIDVCLVGGEASNVDTQFTVALFQDAIANAIAAAPGDNSDTSNPYPTVFTKRMVAGTTGSIAFTVRAGNNTATAFDFNGHGGTQLYGGVCASSISIEEIQA